jgi:2-keto-4-pentenoate hydratase
MQTDLESTIETCAAQIFDARRTRTSIPPVRALLPAKDVAAAYAVQTRNNQRLDAGGARRVGRKIGLTSKVVQQQLGVDRPDFGTLFDFMDLGPVQARISVASLIAPRIEAEMSFRLAKDITTKGLPAAQIARSVESLAASAEIVDSAIAGWDIDIVDTIADNASCGGFVIGAWQPFTPDLDLPSRAMRMTRDSEEISVGAGSASLGDPLNALAWLAEAAIDFGDPLRAGEIVLAGALGPMRPLTPGSYAIEIEGFPPLLLRAVA